MQCGFFFAPSTGRENNCRNTDDVLMTSVTNKKKTAAFSDDGMVVDVLLQ